MKIAITRLRDKAARDRTLCRKYGHDCFTVSPLASSVYRERVSEFVARANGGEFDCIFFTSALPAKIIGPLLERWPRVIAIGPQTAGTLKEMGIEAETLPAFYSRDFAPYLGEWVEGKVIGIPRADVPNPVLMESISSRGGIPREVPVYALVPTGEELQTGDADAILFTSANSFSQAVWNKDERLITIAIGDITAKRMTEGGTTPDIVGDGSLEGTLKAINNYSEEKRNHDR